MSQPPTSRRYQQSRSRSATRSTRPTVPQYEQRSSIGGNSKSRQSPKAGPPSPLSHRTQSFDQSVISAPASISSQRRSSSAQRFPPQPISIPQHKRPQTSHGSLSGISTHRQSSTGTAYENGSIISVPSFNSYHSREIREPTNSRPAPPKKVVRDQSPINIRRSPSEKSIKATKATRKLIEGMCLEYFCCGTIVPHNPSLSNSCDV